MAVLRQELTRTTFQDRQINLMKDISTDVRDLKKEINHSISSLKDSLISGYDKSIQGLYYSFVSYFETGTAAFISDISDIVDDLREGIDEDNDEREKSNQTHQKQAERYQVAIQNQNKELISKVTSIISGIAKLGDIFGISLDRYEELANKYTDLENIAVKNTGLTREAIKEFRDNTLTTVNALNAKSNNLYSGIESFELLVGLINQTGIKNTKFYEEYGEIFLESQKTMNVNLGTLAEFADKFYRKYNLSSSSMGEIVEEVRKNTAGTSTSEEQLLELMNSFDTDITHAVLMMGGDRETQERNRVNISGSIQGAYTWLNENGLNGDYLTKLVIGAMGNDTGSEMTTIRTLGYQGDSVRLAQQFMKDPAGFMIWLVNSIGSKGLGSNKFGKSIASAYGLDFDTAQVAEIAMRDGRLTRQGYNDFINNRQASEDPNAQQWLSAEERTANATEDIAVTMSDAQEALGMKFTTVTNIITSIKDILFAAFALNGGSLWSLLGLGAGGTGATSILGAIGPYGAMAAVIALGADAIIHTIHSSDAADSYIEQLTDIYSRGYGRVNSKGVVTSSNKAPTLQETQESAANAAQRVHDDLEHQDNGFLMNLSSSTSEAILSAFGWSHEDYVNAHNEVLAPGRTDAARRNVAMWDTARAAAEGTGLFEGKEPDDTMLRMLEAYESKGYLSDPRIYNWLMGKSTQGDTLYASGVTVPGLVKLDDGTTRDYGPQKVPILNYALQMFGQGKLILPKYQKGILGSDAEWLGAGYNFSSGDFDVVNAYKKGTNYIPNDQIALLHEGEAVIPATENPFSKYTSSNNNRQSYLAVMAESSKSMSDGNSSNMRSIIDTLSAILEFLKYWKTNNEETDLINSVLDSARTLSSGSSYVSGDDSLAVDDAYAGGVG